MFQKFWVKILWGGILGRKNVKQGFNDSVHSRLYQTSHYYPDQKQQNKRSYQNRNLQHHTHNHQTTDGQKGHHVSQSKDDANWKVTD